MPVLKIFLSLSTVTRDRMESQAAWNANVVFLYTTASPPTRTTRWRDEYFICSGTVPQLLDGMRLVGGRDATLSGGISEWHGLMRCPDRLP
ncbi:hypothetical protein [Belnapia moabensis]|uniref:hypothetical protein n=1 Tax=Belnapia moabensis TaxID=365533 RepID=UPI0005B76EDB|nr:hypothetical protein [Belnapia moabensis]